ncbi:MAG: isopentenyl-diphosphate Delta-isomerase [Gammaproteobacteria bacterium]|nr:isopentenyl-diphosphate Delta-isomerase [Gammaproteobacteria bacterium]
MDRKTSNERSEIVSFETEQLILVDENDRELGAKSKLECHDGHGILHRAFSLFVFNAEGNLLLQQRSADKRLWPMFWSNSCCSHPRFGETMDVAIHRRLEQELGIKSELEYMYKFQYQALFGDTGAEHELCWVYAGRSDDAVSVNASEIAQWRFVSPDDLDKEIASAPEHFTPWFKMEWARLRDDFWDRIMALINGDTAGGRSRTRAI